MAGARPNPILVPPPSAWHEQVWAWLSAARALSEARGARRVAFADLVKAIWASPDAWSRAYRHIFAGAPPAPARPTAPPGPPTWVPLEPDLEEVLHEAGVLGCGQIGPWALLLRVAAKTAAQAKPESGGVAGVWRAPVVLRAPGVELHVRRGLTAEEAAGIAAGRALIALIIDERITSTAERFATPYVEGRFHMLAGKTWVLREPAAGTDLFVLEGTVPDAARHLDAALQELRRRLPGFVPWLPVADSFSTSDLGLLEDTLAALRAWPTWIVGSDPSTGRPWEVVGPDPLVAIVDRMAGVPDGTTVLPLLPQIGVAPDVLGHGAMAAAIAASLAISPDLPLGIGVLGPKGSGKTDLLQRIARAWTELPALPPRERERCAPRRATLWLNAVDDDPDALTIRILEVLGRPPSPPAAPPSTSRSRRDMLLDTWFPNEGDEDPRLTWAIGIASAGAVAAMNLEAPFSAFAGLIAWGGAALGWRPALALARTTLAPPAPPPIAPPRPPPSLIDPPLESPPRLLVVLDDLDRASVERARGWLVHLKRRVLDPAPIPVVLVAAAESETLNRAVPEDQDLDSWFQASVQLDRLDPSRWAVAASAWTGIEAKPPAAAPHLTLAGPAPAPLPIVQELPPPPGPTVLDADALVRYRAWSRGTPRALRRLVNQISLARRLAPGEGEADPLVFWLCLADGHPRAAAALATTLPGASSQPWSEIAQRVSGVLPPEDRARWEEVAGAGPGLEPDQLARTARAALRWTPVNVPAERPAPPGIARRRAG